ncbi:C4-dicarboxylate transporter DcuC [Bradyrhizobium sp. S69]|uniref:C4-dicarboxylate transporter DcuC n=1 Tax=Bradyrhizobium sp. S69 TaxID=1641856 RepID=UPI00131E2E97|nr:C4-dicarboxylate transporter DcuC [Bradyrhizobium sp. S69]
MLGLLIGVAVVAVAATLIARNYQPQTVLLVTGLILLALTSLVFPDHSILYQNAKSIGWKGFDVFAFVKESLIAQISGIGLIIMASAAFADYMDHIGATASMVRFCIKPLRLIKAPYLILASGYVLGQCLHVAIPSAAGLAMLLLVTFFPMMVSLGVSKPAAAAMIALCSFMDIGPAVGTANLAARTAGIPPAVYFVRDQIPVVVWVVGVVAILLFFSARYLDRGRDGSIFRAQPEPAIDEQVRDDAPGFYALLPLVPITLILVFSPLLVGEVTMDVVTAMVIGSVAGLICELLVKRDIRTAFKGFQVFFNGIGSSFAGVVSLLVCADVFAHGLEVVGAVDYMIGSVRDAGFGINVMALAMTLMVGVTAMITGSGVAAFFAFSGLAPGIATNFGVSAVTMLLPMQLMAGMGRAISPVSGVIIAVSKAGECRPFEIVGRTIIPSIGGMVTMILVNYLRNG